jgi:hypothetical protein
MAGDDARSSRRSVRNGLLRWEGRGIMNDEERLETIVEELRRIATARGLRSKEAKAMKQWAASLLKRVDLPPVPE